MEEQICQGSAYTLVYIIDELMGVLKKKLPCRFMHSNSIKKFKSVIGFGFSVVVYTYETAGRANNWVVLFKVTRGIHDIIRMLFDT